MTRHLLFVIILLAFLQITTDAALAQDSIDIIIYIDEDSLTVYVGNWEPIFIEDLVFRVGDGEVSPLETHPLKEYSTFKESDFRFIHDPFCFRLERHGSQKPVPQICQQSPAGLRTHPLSDVDIFWYDDIRHVGHIVSILNGEIEAKEQCQVRAGEECHVNYPRIDPDPTPFPSPTPPDNGGPRTGDMREFKDVLMVYVPEGCFIMGKREYYREHGVCLSAFWIGQTEVSNAQYAECVHDGVCEEPSPYYLYFPDYPVTYITYEQATNYAKWLGGSLPTEAQWEYAARGPEENLYPWGDWFNSSWLNYCPHRTECGSKKTMPVGNYPRGASWVGALNMAGNVWEWVADWYDENYYNTQRDSMVDPIGPSSGSSRVIRGGSFQEGEDQVTSVWRGYAVPNAQDPTIGFRVVIPAY
ncbi:MAG: formylglycine-generating enzyme family protein [Anaerolineae bacterium]|nr:formylglycine-generating enzyme family protein [Anaerolineae bacterium]